MGCCSVSLSCMWEAECWEPCQVKLHDSRIFEKRPQDNDLWYPPGSPKLKNYTSLEWTWPPSLFWWWVFKKQSSKNSFFWSNFLSLDLHKYVNSVNKSKPWKGSIVSALGFCVAIVPSHRLDGIVGISFSSRWRFSLYRIFDATHWTLSTV